MLGPSALGTELTFNTLESLIAAFIVAHLAAGLRSARAGVALICFSATITTDGWYWNWHHYPTDYFMAQIASNTIGALLAGLAIAKIVSRKE